MTEENQQREIQGDDLYLESPKAFHLEMPLYHELDILDPETAERVYACISYRGTIDAYCVWCGKESVFNTVERFGDEIPRQGQSRTEAWIERGSDFDRVVHACTRNHSHEYYAYYFKGAALFTKIGQWPSAADFQIPQADKYRKMLGEERYKELTKGIGLSAHGVGIGAFVYLRRVFEKLIEEAHLIAKENDEAFNDETYLKARMDQKIQILRDHLPSFLVENRLLYGILSKGVHELTEDECRKYFEAVRIGIEQILDEKIIQEEKFEKAEKAREAIHQTHAELS